MIKMLEVVGISYTSFSEAVNETIRELLKSGSKIHWFEVVEQRGTVKNGKSIEYQVILKVGIEE